MFEQSPTVGPGTGTVTQHTAEIMLLLLGAFLLGLLLHWLLTRTLSQQIKTLKEKLAWTTVRLTAAERAPQPTARLRASTTSEHERTLTQLRESRETEARARERIIELEGHIALLENAAALAAASPPPAATRTPKSDADLLASVLPFVESAKPKPKSE